MCRKSKQSAGILGESLAVKKRRSKVVEGVHWTLESGKGTFGKPASVQVDVQQKRTIDEMLENVAWPDQKCSVLIVVDGNLLRIGDHRRRRRRRQSSRKLLPAPRPLSHKIHHLLPDRFLIDDPFPAISTCRSASALTRSSSRRFSASSASR